ncbi:MAG: hypothetical protein KDK39_10935 [Leptospiraceae bacterium]|nr:hypothetical protein [Leptospiraceae bacterium]
MTPAIENLIANREVNFPEGLLEARQTLQSAMDSPETSAPASLALVEVLFWLGDYSETKEDKNKYFAEGVAVGKIAVEKNPESAAAHMWFASNMGQHGLIQGIMKSASYMGPIEKHGKKACDLDEGFFYSAPLRLMGRFYHQAPGFPIGPGNNTKSQKMLEKAVEKNPEFSYNKLYLADLLLSRSKKQDAKALLEAVIAAPALEGMAGMEQRVKSEAQELLKKVS